MYSTLFKCGRKRIADFPNLCAWMRDMHQLELPEGSMQIRNTIDIDAARNSYYTNLFPLNPGGIVAAGPTAADLQLHLPANRGPTQLSDVCVMTSQV